MSQLDDMSDHYREAENLLGFARTHTDTGDERDQMLAETFTASAQVHALLALAGGPRGAKPAEPTTVPLRRAADTWGDDIEVQSVERPGIRWRVRGGKRLRINVDGATWLGLTERSVAMVTLVSREPYRDDPWAPGQDVTAPRMDEPTRLGSVVVAGGPGVRCFIIRMGEFSSGPWHWRDSEREKLYRWDYLIDPRPATEQEVEEGRVIEP